jgi:NAD(P)-dependent dehydrogenase (short-subunit alcohol dehydrogenase family)
MGSAALIAAPRMIYLLSDTPHGGASKGKVAIVTGASKGIGAAIARQFAKAGAAFGTPSILVNNAGVYSFAPLEDVTEAEFHRQFDTNVLSTILTTRKAAASVRQGRRQRHQFQHHFEREPGAELGHLFGLEERGRCSHQGARQ